MTDILDFFSALEYEWMQRAFFSAILIGIICSVIGVFIILRGIIFLGEAIAHSAFAGAALAILLGFEDPILMVLIFGITTALGIGYANEKNLVGDDEIIIGVAFTFFMALAIFFIGLIGSYKSNITSILFGSILLITPQNFTLLILFTIIVTSIILLLKKEFYFITFDQDLAIASGVPVRFLNYLFLILIALAIDVSLTAIGAILVFAMLITPAAAAYQLTYKLNRMLILAVIFGITSTVGGLMISYLYDWPSGASIVLLATLIFFVTFFLSPKRISFWRRFIHIKPPIDDFERLPHFHGDAERPTHEFLDHLREKIITNGHIDVKKLKGE
ncbi:MAG: metal ABC transporter permease [Candidatus Kariarchaeaceae archaeon]|jgi:ABC-type Mn2+/Zn2+ transport system permease subunit